MISGKLKLRNQMLRTLYCVQIMGAAYLTLLIFIMCWPGKLCSKTHYGPQLRLHVTAFYASHLEVYCTQTHTRHICWKRECNFYAPRRESYYLGLLLTGYFYNCPTFSILKYHLIRAAFQIGIIKTYTTCCNQPKIISRLQILLIPEGFLIGLMLHVL